MTQTSYEDATPTLVPILSDRWALGWRHVLVCTWFSLFFGYLNYTPLFYSDIWGHVHYGQWMLEHRELVNEDPFMPLAAGMHAVNNAWLSQLLFAQLYEWGGPHFLSHAFALVGLGTYLLYFRSYFLFSGRILLALLGVLMVLTVGWTRHAIIRPEIFGTLFVAALLWMLAHTEPWRSRWQPREGMAEAKEQTRCPTWIWFAIPALFMVWVNMHGSFAVGLVILACHASGRAIEVAWQSRSVVAVLRDPWVRTWTLLTEIAVLATLVNPYGVDMLIETATFGRNPNLRDILEWYPLRLMDLEGIHFLISMIILVVVARHSRLHFRAVDVLLLLVFAGLTAPSIRMIGWYAPVFAFVMMPHVADILCRLFPKPAAAVPPVGEEGDSSAEPASDLKFAGTLLCGLIIFCIFAITPFSQVFMGGRLRRPDQIYSRHTPLGISGYLKEHPAKSMIYAPQWWGDWMAWDGRPDTKVFMTTHIHLAPQQVWKDYQRIQNGVTGWDRTLDRYRVRTLVVDKDRQKELVRALRGNDQWQIVYEDKLGIVANRLNPPS